VARGGKKRLRQTAKMKAADVARLGHAGFRAQKAVQVTGARNQLFVFLSRHLPRNIPRRVIKYYNRTAP
jgi:short-subunit dehydrogenase